MFIAVAGSGCRGLKSIKDQVSTDICSVAQASESDLVARGVAFDLLHVAKRVGTTREKPIHRISPVALYKIKRCVNKPRYCYDFSSSAY